MLPCVSISRRVCHDRHHDRRGHNGSGRVRRQRRCGRAWTARTSSPDQWVPPSYQLAAFLDRDVPRPRRTYTLRRAHGSGSRTISSRRAGFCVVVRPPETDRDAQYGPLQRHGASDHVGPELVPNLGRGHRHQDFLAVPITPLFGTGGTSEKDG